MIKGMSFPDIFSEGTTKRVSGKEKLRANLNLLLRQSTDVLLFKPGFGISYDYILFADEVAISRDFILTFVKQALKSVPDVELSDVVVTKKGDKLDVDLSFEYSPSRETFNINYIMEGALYE